MKIKVLGSAAAEGIPALWCECETCEKARQLKGKDLRRRTSYLLDEDTLVDFGPDAYWQINEFGVDLLKIERIVYTHRHSDHLSPLELFWRRKCGWLSKVSKSINVFGGFHVFTRIIAECGMQGETYKLDDLNIIPCELSHGKFVEDNGLGILPLNADHDLGRNAFVYVFSRQGAKVLICNDTGFLPEATWAMLAGQQVDVAIIDCTFGTLHPEWDGGHMGSGAVVRMRLKLLEIGALKEDGRVFANHFSHNGHSLHSDLERYFIGKHIGVAYDGMEIEI